MINKIISGGQTGVDRAALDVAIALNIPHGGWCPQGRIAEDGVISLQYQLQETPTTDYSERTAWNVRDSDGTLLITRGQLIGGTQLTLEIAQLFKKPYFIMDLTLTPDMATVLSWFNANNIRVLNIAGARESQSPGIYQLTVVQLQQLLKPYLKA